MIKTILGKRERKQRGNTAESTILLCKGIIQFKIQHLDKSVDCCHTLTQLAVYPLCISIVSRVDKPVGDDCKRRISVRVSVEVSLLKAAACTLAKAIVSLVRSTRERLSAACDLCSNLPQLLPTIEALVTSASRFQCV
jgi:hypothetical protein